MLKLYSTLEQKKRKFKPILKTKVKIYTCGPTVYDYAHIGNLRAMISADILKRTLEYCGYKVKHIKNITDVGHLTSDQDFGEDKVLAKARLTKKTPEQIAKFFTKAFLRDEKRLNILPADYFPRATDHIEEMIEMTKTLIKKGYAYEADGNVYFSVAKFKKYGQLSGNTLKKLKAGARVKKTKGKKSPFDFALWRKAPDNYLITWDSPWSKGFPGWHIECSAMAKKYLGSSFDIHTGGEDNIFPHHEDEIAQSTIANRRKPVNYWVHTRWLLVDKKKMSKSEENFYTLRDLESKGYSPHAFRLLILQSHYRSQANFTIPALKTASLALQKLEKFTSKVRPLKPKNNVLASDKIQAEIAKAKKQFEKHITNDLDTPKALAVLFLFMKKINFFKFLFTKDKQAIYQTLLEFDKVLGLGLDKIKRKQIKTSPEIKKLLKKRDSLRKKKKFKAADKIRKQLAELEFIVEDKKMN